MRRQQKIVAVFRTKIHRFFATGSPIPTVGPGTLDLPLETELLTPISNEHICRNAWLAPLS